MNDAGWSESSPGARPKVGFSDVAAYARQTSRKATPQSRNILIAYQDLYCWSDVLRYRRAVWSAPSTAVRDYADWSAPPVYTWKCRWWRWPVCIYQIYVYTQIYVDWWCRTVRIYQGIRGHGTDQSAYTKDTCVQWYRPGCIYAENGSLHIPRYMWLVMVQARLCITGYMQTDGTDKPANYTQE